MKTPIAFLIFNRPQNTQTVFNAIRQVKPSRLLVVADGPRAEHLLEAERCQVARSVIEQVDWPCEVLTNYSDVNLGCKKRISSGLDWVFGKVEEAIILEDDCLPHPSFFLYCEALLERYRNDTRIVSIGGHNVQFNNSRTSYSYYYSRYFHCWGWASWRRAWKHYDINMRLWPEVRDTGLLRLIYEHPSDVAYWSRIFQETYDGLVDTWDYQAAFAFLIQSGLSVIPKHNLVSNIGFDASSSTNTQTDAVNSPYANMPTAELTLPLQHPPYVLRHIEADLFTQRTLFNPTFQMRATAKARRMLKLPAYSELNKEGQQRLHTQ